MRADVRFHATIEVRRVGFQPPVKRAREKLDTSLTELPPRSFPEAILLKTVRGAIFLPLFRDRGLGPYGLDA